VLSRHATAQFFVQQSLKQALLRRSESDDGSKAHMNKRQRRRARKGSLEETLSYAMHADNPRAFEVEYRDRDVLKTAWLKEFMEGEEFSEIPVTRIVRITRQKVLVWEKGQKRVTLKENLKGKAHQE
jgi:uncharacterized protein (UPF0248 family)